MAGSFPAAQSSRRSQPEESKAIRCKAAQAWQRQINFGLPNDSDDLNRISHQGLRQEPTVSSVGPSNSALQVLSLSCIPLRVSTP